MPSRPNRRLKPSAGDSLDASGFSLSGTNMKPVWIRLPPTPARAAADITPITIGARASRARRMTMTPPSPLRSNWSGWATNGSNWAARLRDIHPPAMARKPAAAARVAKAGKSIDLATSPRLRASSSFRGEASSVFVDESLSATGAPHTNTPMKAS